jgi:peptidoglycan/LPS O-acetylase OafA/YrhL
MQPAHKYLSNLTSLRGIAALWVLIYHFEGVLVHFIPRGSTMLVGKGYLMVDLFFIMSGFIITHVYQKSFEAGPGYKNFKRFFIARFARIYPLHLFALIILILWVAKVGAGALAVLYDPAAIPTNLFLIHSFGIHKVFTWNVPSWSISAEWWAYMVFPFLAFFLNRRKKPAVAGMFLFVVFSYLALMFWLPRRDPFDPAAIVPHDLNTTFDYGYLRGLAGFISGMLVYKIYEEDLFRKFFQKDRTALLIIICTLVCLHIGINDGFYIIFFAILVYIFACNSGKLHMICSNRVAQYIGKISYSIYLISMLTFFPFIRGLMHFPGVQYPNGYEDTGNAGLLVGAGWCLLLVLIHIGISSLTYYGIEKPCRKFINKKLGKEAMPVYA